MKIIITGASSGIGESMAEIFRNQGHQVIAVGRDKNRLDKLKDRIQCETIQLDISTLENCQELFAQVPDADVLVNNAGFGYIGDFEECPLSKELDMIDINIKAMHILTKLYLPGMEQRKKGYILNVASIAGFLPGPEMATYYATKSYVVRFTQGLAEEMRQRKTGVYIGALCPGPVATRFNETAGCDFKARSMSSSRVAELAIQKMWKKKEIIVVGISAKVVRLGAKICSDRLMGRMVSKMQFKKKNKKH